MRMQAMYLSALHMQYLDCLSASVMVTVITDITIIVTNLQNIITIGLITILAGLDIIVITGISAGKPITDMIIETVTNIVDILANTATTGIDNQQSIERHTCPFLYCYKVLP